MRGRPGWLSPPISSTLILSTHLGTEERLSVAAMPRDRRECASSDFGRKARAPEPVAHSCRGLGVGSTCPRRPRLRFNCSRRLRLRRACDLEASQLDDVESSAPAWAILLERVEEMISGGTQYLGTERHQGSTTQSAIRLVNTRPGTRAFRGGRPTNPATPRRDP
jgi:hypothetical protein